MDIVIIFIYRLSYNIFKTKNIGRLSKCMIAYFFLVPFFKSFSKLFTINLVSEISKPSLPKMQPIHLIVILLIFFKTGESKLFREDKRSYSNYFNELCKTALLYRLERSMFTRVGRSLEL